MTLLRVALACLGAALLSASAVAAPPERLSYTVTPDPANGVFHVHIVAEKVTGGQLTVALPAWSPGWYVLNQAYRDIHNLKASAGGQALSVTALDNHSWRIATQAATQVMLSYSVRASDTDYGFFQPYLDQKHGFVPGATTLMYVVDGKSVPCTITYAVPTGWQVASANDPVGAAPNTFSAPDYDTLIDHPADLGTFRRYDRTIDSVPISIVLVGAEGVSSRLWVDRVFQIARAGIRLFGQAPFPRYVFHFRFANTDGFQGGLEHKNATVIRLPVSDLREAGPENLSVVAHEFVHAWNVKRIRPAGLGPFDYTRPVRVKDLWFCEGVTDYYAPRLLVEAGIATQDYWLGYMSEQLRQLMNNRARKVVTLEESSLRVWEGADESQGYGGLSYYNKGLIVGLLLDISLRHQTKNTKGLDQLLLSLLDQSQRTGRGFAEGEIERVASQLAGSDLAPFFQKALRSTADFDWVAALRQGGIAVEEHKAEQPYLGILWDFAASGASGYRVQAVAADGPAARAGLAAGDKVIAVNGKPVEQGLSEQASSGSIGAELMLTVERAGGVQKLRLTIGAEETHTYRFRPLTNPTPLQSAILAKVSGSASSRSNTN